jgi:midasin (ATPase involved in ribosome maturation)
MEDNADTHFEYGGRKIAILNQDPITVPAHAIPVDLSKEEYESIALGIDKNLPILLIGEAGTGKTSIARYLAFRRKQGYVRINMHGYATPDELIGSKSIRGGATYHEDGVLVNAMRKGYLVVLDEVNATPADCLFVLHGLLDEDKRITLPNGEIIHPHKDFRFMATMNPEYEGTKSLNRAFIDRFPIILTIDTLTPEKEKELIMSRYSADGTTVDTMIKVAFHARKSYQDQKTLTHVSTRTLLQWAELIEGGVAHQKAYEITVANKARGEEKTAFMDFYHAVMKTSANDNAQDKTILVTQGHLDRFASQIESLTKKVEEKNLMIIKAKGLLKEAAGIITTLTNAKKKKKGGKKSKVGIQSKDLSL